MALQSSAPKQRSIKPKLSFDSIPRKVGELYLVVSEGTLCSAYDIKNNFENWAMFIQTQIECQEQTSSTACGRQLVWNNKFKYDIWSYHFTISLQLFRMVKDKPKKVSEYSLPLDVKAISSGQVLNVAFPGDKKKTPIAFVKLFLQFIYHSHEYTKLENLILDTPPILGAIIDAYKSIKIHSTEELSAALHCLFSSHNRQLELQKYIITHEIERISDINLMFRADTLGIQLITEFVNRTGHVFLEKFSEQFMKTTNFKLTIELDPECLKGEDDLKTNQKRMVERADSFFDALLACQKYIHPNIREICKYIMVSTSKRLAIDSTQSQEQIKNDSYIAMGAILFLRYIVPCLVRQCVNIDRRSTVLLAKLVTAIGNNVSFGDKEPFMNSMNEYVRKKKAWIGIFFSSILNTHSVLDAQSNQQESTPLCVYKTLLCFLKENQQVLVDHLSRFKSEKEASASENLLDVLYEFTTRELGDLHTVPSLPNMSFNMDSSPSHSPPISHKILANSSPPSTTSSPTPSNSSLLGNEGYSESISTQFLASIRN